MSTSNKDLLKEAKSFCENHIVKHLDVNIYQYHNLSHVKEMNAVAQELAKEYGLSEDQKTNIEVACWFHDVGYAEGAEGHEERAVTLVRPFLENRGVPTGRIKAITELILATKMGVKPEQIEHQIIKDADCHHLGTRSFFATTAKLKSEIETLTKVEITEKEWLTNNLKFLHVHKFYTPVAASMFNDRKRKNILKVQKLLTSLIEYENNVVAIDADTPADLALALPSSKADRGIETMYRVTLRNHNSLSVIADNKANIMLSINSIMLSIVLSSLASKLDTNPHLLVPTTILTLVCMVSVIIAVMATRPKISSAPYSDEAFMNKKFNMLFFGNFYKLPLDKFEWGLKTLMNNEEMLYSSLTKDLYFLGVVLARKYRLLWYCYNVFAIGIIVSAIAFIWAFSISSGTIPAN